MKVHTTRFGDVEVPEEHVISLPGGVLGFPESKRFILLEHDSEGTPFKWLQSVDSPALAFIVMDPNLMIPDYRVELDPESAELFGVGEATENLATMSIVNVPRDNPVAMTVNVRAPIVVHLTKRVGRQVILPNEEYQIRHRIFPDPVEPSPPPRDALTG
jgi:flagellar assembly factor FliW